MLIQLGEELVTDIEQAILECVKNAYDADSPGCSIKIDTHSTGTVEQLLPPEKLKFKKAAENVAVSFLSPEGRPLELTGLDDVAAKRVLSWRGSISIEDKGDGLSPEQIKSSWLVISGSKKRAVDGKKRKTNTGRTPLGDKGLGRLGSMKLGDILRVESAQRAGDELASATFRWGDCDDAATVSEIPVLILSKPNRQRFKGTRVSVLGLRDLETWSTPSRALELTKSLARLISPFEAKSQFPVTVDVDGHKTSLVAVTDELLSRSLAEFQFNWHTVADGTRTLNCVAKFKERLFRSSGQKGSDKGELVFTDGGEQFLTFLSEHTSLKRYAVTPRPSSAWFVQLEQNIPWNDLRPSAGADVVDPGSLSGAFYYFHLTDLDNPDSTSEVDTGAAAGMAVPKELIKAMAGISILRDGFRVRSPGDWLRIAEGMTTGSTYGLRYHNTLGYFGLTGEHNSGLVEKSDREGFVENSAFRGFMAIAEECKKFANDAIVLVRRGQDKLASTMNKESLGQTSQSPGHSLDVVEDSVKMAADAQEAAAALVASIEDGVSKLAAGPSALGKEATESLKGALKAAKSVQKQLEAGKHASTAVRVLRQEQEDNKERLLSLYESAAVGLSARGLAHELRTHIVEIRKRVSSLDTLVKNERATPEAVGPHVRSIRASLSSIAGAAALIDPLLPRTRAVKESIDLIDFVQTYIENRSSSLEAQDISFSITSDSVRTRVKMNRGRLLAVLDNLVRNSVYWLNRGESVLGVARPKRIRVQVTSTGFVLWDTGPGIATEYESNIFEIFVTSKPARERGQGLGLFIITQLLEADGAAIHLGSTRNSDGRRYKFAVDLSSVVEGEE